MSEAEGGVILITGVAGVIFIGGFLIWYNINVPLGIALILVPVVLLLLAWGIIYAYQNASSKDSNHSKTPNNEAMKSAFEEAGMQLLANVA